MVRTSKRSRAPIQKLTYERSIKAPKKLVKLIDTLKSKLTTTDNPIIPILSTSQSQINENIHNSKQTLTDPLESEVHNFVTLNGETSSKSPNVMGKRKKFREPYPRRGRSKPNF